MKEKEKKLWQRVIISSVPYVDMQNCARFLVMYLTHRVRNADIHRCTEYKRKEGAFHGRKDLQPLCLLGSCSMPHYTGKTQ